MPKSLSLRAVADALEGELIGDGTQLVTRLAHPADLQNRADLIVAMDGKLLSLLKDRDVACAVVSSKNKDESAFIASRILVDRPRLALAHLTALFAEPSGVKLGVHASAVIETSASLGKNVAIGAQSYIGENVSIGDNSVIHPQCYIGEGAIIGPNALIHAGVKIAGGTRIGARIIVHFNATIGADGFSFVTPQAGSVEVAKATGGKGGVVASNTALIRISSLAPVMIGDDVEIGANTSIDKGTIVSTRIGNGTKVDNQVQIGHNVVIGENCMICGRVGIAGSAVIGDRVVLGGAVGVADHLSVGDDAIVMGMSGVGGNIAPRSIVGGTPAMPREKAMENLCNVGRLKQFFKKIEQLGERVDKLEKEQR